MSHVVTTTTTTTTSSGGGFADVGYTRTVQGQLKIAQVVSNSCGYIYFTMKTCSLLLVQL